MVSSTNCPVAYIYKQQTKLLKYQFFIASYLIRMILITIKFGMILFTQIN